MLRPARATDDSEAPFLVILGIAQDAGYPQAGCRGACCAPAWADPSRRRLTACAAVVDPLARARWLIDATPDFKLQLAMLDAVAPPTARPPDLSGILLTHGHIGHCAGLWHLGRESMGADAVPVRAMPRLADYLARNGPWRQLCAHRHIVLEPLSDGVEVRLGTRVAITPMVVPHRDEVSETVGFRIDGPDRRVLYLPDIDQWSEWSVPIEQTLFGVDVAYLDGTFYQPGEVHGRDLAAIPHPPITDTMALLAPLPATLRARVRFTHLNHTNPALDPESAAARAVADGGFALAVEGEQVAL